MRNQHYILSSARCGLIALGLLPAALHAQAERLRAIDRYVEQARQDWGAPAIAVSIVKDDSLVFAKGYGVLEVGQATRADAHTIFAIGSASKAFTAASMGMLVDEGKVAWGDRAVDYLPWFKVGDAWVTRELMVRELMAHNIGIDRADVLWGGTAWSRNEVLRRVQFVPQAESFRSAYGYNNLMWIAAGQVVATTTGRSWDDFVRTRIFDPLGMARSRTSTTPLPAMTNVAAPHTKAEGKVVAIPWRNIDNAGPAGSINSSVTEMAQWVRLHLGYGKIDGKRLLDSATVAAMHAPQTIIPKEEWLSSLSPVNHQMVPETHFFLYGMGWFLQDYRGRKLVHHGGSIDGMRALVGMVPEEQLGVVILTNLNPSSIDEAIMFRVFDHYLGGPKRDWSAEILAGWRKLEGRAEMARRKRDESRVLGTNPTLAWEEYVGAYADSAYGTVQVEAAGGGLDLRWELRPGSLAHWHYDTFQVTWAGARGGTSLATFSVDARGKVSELRLGGQTFGRVPARDETVVGSR